MCNRARTCFALYLLMFGFWFLPRLLGVLELLLDTKQRQRYGGARRLGLSTVADAVFTLLLGTVMAVTQTLFICALFCGRRVTWEAQHRESGGVRTIDAARQSVAPDGVRRGHGRHAHSLGPRRIARGVAHLALLPGRDPLRDANRIGAARPFHATPALVRGARRARMTGKSQVAKLKKRKIEGCAA